MESLFQLVADSFVRHGIEAPAQAEATVVAKARSTEQAPPAELPDHNYRKKVEPAAPDVKDLCGADIPVCAACVDQNG